MLVLTDSELPIFTENMVRREGRRYDLKSILINVVDNWYSWILEPVKKKKKLHGIERKEGKKKVQKENMSFQ